MASFAIRVTHPDAPQHLIIRLDPAELGRVQMSIERTPGGSARVELTVERADTLLLLLRDQPQLHYALDLAGVPAGDRTLQFHLAPSGAAPSSPMSAHSNPDFTNSSGPNQQRPPTSSRHGSGDVSEPDDPASLPTATWRRAGINIMA